jgi:hypothetical protein
MKIVGLIWLDDIVEKLSWKHHVLPDDVREILHNRPHFRFVEKGNRPGKHVYMAMGQQREDITWLSFLFTRKTRKH